MKLLLSICNLIGNIIQLTESKYCTQNSRYLLFCDMMYFVPAWSLFTGPVTNVILHRLWNVNKIYVRTDINSYISLIHQLIRYTHRFQCVYLVKTFYKSLKLFDGKIKLLRSIYSHHQLDIDYGF